MGLLGRITGAFLNRQPARMVRVVTQRPIRGSYDLAQTNDGNRRHWAAADALDADSANSVTVRQAMTRRSRMETGNNGYLKGITLTHANYVVGRGPRLRMQTASAGFNAMVEAAWNRWASRVKLARKLRTVIKSKVADGEAFLLVKQNLNLSDNVKLDLVGIECEQVTSTDLLWSQPNRVDGIHFDEFGNPTAYDILPYHPGGQWSLNNRQAEQVPAKFVFHLFREDRPRQHRAIPELSSTLSTGAQSRRWRESTLQASENQANFNAFLKSNASPDETDYNIAPLSTMEIEKGGVMIQLPDGTEPIFPKIEQPSATYEGFLHAQISEQARPLSMGFGLAACDNSESNFAAGKLDQLPYFCAVDVEQADAEDLVLDPLFALWFEEAVKVYGWVGPESPAPAHDWGWPRRPVIDEVKTATARQIDLSTGVLSPSEIAAEDGYDFAARLAILAKDYGVTTDEMREKLLAANLERKAAAPASDPAGDGSPGSDGKPVNRITRYGKNGNGSRLAKRGT